MSLCCGGVAVCWLDAESYRPRPCCWTWGPWAYCRGVVVLGCAAGAWVSAGLLLGSVSTERNMSRYVRPARRSAVGRVSHGAQLIRPTHPGWLWRGVDGSCQFRVCSCVLGRCTRSVGNAPLLNGCSVPDRVHGPVTGAAPPLCRCFWWWCGCLSGSRVPSCLVARETWQPLVAWSCRLEIPESSGRASARAVRVV